MALRSLVAGGCWLGAALIVSMGNPLVVLGALAVAVFVAGGVAWSAVRLTPLTCVLTATLLILIRVAAGPWGVAVALLLFLAGALLHVQLRDAALGLALFGGTVSILGGADVRLLVSFLLLGAVTQPIAEGAKLFCRRIWQRLLARERPPVGPLGAES